jgi:ABC-type transport system involved in multi-copper enzyme maturation permease subunit
LGREIAQKTVLTVISKPVGRPVFLVGKFIGVAAALLLAILCLSLVFMMTEMHAVIETVRDPVHVPVLVFGFGSLALGLIIAAWCNFFYGTVFTSTALFVITPMLLVGYLLALNFEPDFTQRPMAEAFRTQIWKAVLAICVAQCMLAAFAVAFSTRLGQVMTLLATLGILLIGLLSDWLFARPLARIEAIWLERAEATGQVETVDVVTTLNRVGDAPEEIIRAVQVATEPLTTFAQGSEMASWLALKAAYGIVPNFQVLWLSDALTQNVIIPNSYLLSSIGYGLMYTLMALALGIILFQRRELG